MLLFPLGFSFNLIDVLHSVRSCLMLMSSLKDVGGISLSGRCIMQCPIPAHCWSQDIVIWNSIPTVDPALMCLSSWMVLRTPWVVDILCTPRPPSSFGAYATILGMFGLKPRHLRNLLGCFCLGSVQDLLGNLG